MEGIVALEDGRSWVRESVEEDLMDATWADYYEQNDDMEGLPFCPRCRSDQGQWRGYRKTHKQGVIHRRKCNDCGRWHGEARQNDMP